MTQNVQATAMRIVLNNWSHCFCIPISMFL